MRRVIFLRLFIAEKPSFAEAIAGGLGNPKRKSGYFETDGGIVTWCYGHILRTFEPEEYDARFKRWNLADLPIVPKVWELAIVDRCKDQAVVIQGLLKKATDVVNAGDPDREGCLLVDEVIEYFSYKGKVLRIWVSAMDDKSIKDALGNLKDNEKYRPMRDAAEARRRADWLLGMNGTRAYTCYARRAGYSQVQNVGRVKTPTLALVVRREREIKGFTPVHYANVKGEFKKDLKFAANWKPRDGQLGLDSEDRLVDQSALDGLMAKLSECKEKAIVTFCKTSPESKAAPLPFSLSALQIAAGKMFGHSPAKVLEIMQKLYEGKLTTYPRSDCDYLPESQYGDSEQILKNLGAFDEKFGGWVKGANPKMKSRAWNDKKITAHHAIIPTTVKADKAKLSKEEQDLYFLIARGYVAQFYGLFKFDKTNAELLFAGEKFAVGGSVTVSEGYKVLYIKQVATSSDDDDDIEGKESILPKMWKDEAIDFLKASFEWKKTEPPKRFTEATLVDAMKNIHKYVVDAEKKERLKDTKGIGTEATRSSIIEELITRGFMKVVKKNLEPTAEGYLIIDAMPLCITIPDETAEWEDALAQIELNRGDVTMETFLAGFIKRLPDLLLLGKEEANFEAKWPCPECEGGGLVRRPGKEKGTFWWGCSNYPGCKVTMDDEKGEPVAKKANAVRVVSKDHPCPECKDGFLTKRKGVGGKGDWWGCSCYPACKATRPDSKGKPGEKSQGVLGGGAMNKDFPCPECKEGFLTKRKGASGKKDWWGCNGYPKCKVTRFDDGGKPGKK